MPTKRKTTTTRRKATSSRSRTAASRAAREERDYIVDVELAYEDGRPTRRVSVRTGPRDSEGWSAELDAAVKSATRGNKELREHTRYRMDGIRFEPVKR